MALAEFELITRYFMNIGRQRTDVAMGIGDDAAVLCPGDGSSIMTASAMLSVGSSPTHAEAPGMLAYRCLSSAMTALSATGATPAWVTLALSLPHADAEWLTGFADGLDALMQTHNLQLIGGDTTRGPLCITVTVDGPLAGRLDRPHRHTGSNGRVTAAARPQRAREAITPHFRDADPSRLAALLVRLHRTTMRPPRALPVGHLDARKREVIISRALSAQGCSTAMPGGVTDYCPSP